MTAKGGKYTVRIYMYENILFDKEVSHFLMRMRTLICWQVKCTAGS